MTLKGNTREFPLDVLIRLLGDTKKTGELSLRADHGEGALGLAEGRVVTAVFGEESAIPALGSVFEIKDAEFEFTPWNDPPSPNLEGELSELLQKAKEYREWLASVREVIPSDRTRFRLSERAAEQGAVTFTPDRWRVVLAVNGQRSVTEIASHLRIERDNALGILSGLVRDGVIDSVEPASVDAAPPTPSPPPAAEFRSRPTMIEDTPPPAPTPEPEPEPQVAAAPEPIAETAPPPPVFNEPPAPPPPPQGQPESPQWEAPPNQWGGFSNTSAPAPSPAAPETAVPSDWSSLPAPAPHTPEPYVPAPSDWSAVPASAPAPQEHAPEPPPMPADWSAAAPAAPQPAQPAPAPTPSDWSMPASNSAAPSGDWAQPASGASAPTSVDDRLASIFGESTAPAAPSAPASDWGTPAKSDWSTPAPAAPSTDAWSAPAAPQTAPEIDPRLAALTMPAPVETPPAPAPRQSAPAQPAMAPAAAAEAPAKKKGGLFGGLFGGGAKQEKQEKQDKQDRTAAPAAAPMPPGAGRSRPGRLAAFANALLAEYASGQYGKGKIDDRMASLLMRVDEQADPIDRPLPVVDDRLDVEALERVSIADAQASPYLALLVSTIYADAEKAFGKDKAKRGYKSAQQQILGADMSALTGPDLAGKLPKV